MSRTPTPEGNPDGTTFSQNSTDEQVKDAEDQITYLRIAVDLMNEHVRAGGTINLRAVKPTMPDADTGIWRIQVVDKDGNARTAAGHTLPAVVSEVLGTVKG